MVDLSLKRTTRVGFRSSGAKCCKPLSGFAAFRAERLCLSVRPNLLEAAPQEYDGGEASRINTRTGKAEPFRTEGGRAAKRK